MDLSVAPEIAQFAQPGPVADRLACPGTAGDPSAVAIPVARSGAVGDLAATLSALVAEPAGWWDLARFDPAGPVRVPLSPGVWLLALPPRHETRCCCRLATLVAGEATEDGYRLRPGGTRVHGRTMDHVLRSADAGYAVTLHAWFQPDGGGANHPPG